MPGNYHCVPVCFECRQAQSCPKADQPLDLTLPATHATPWVLKDVRVRRSPNADWAPNRETLMMPCGCWALPLELFRGLGDRFDSFICDSHGVVKVTDKWRKDTKKIVANFVRVPSEYGYTVEVQDTL